MIDERSFKEIYSDVRFARERKKKLIWTSEEIAIDMLVVSKKFIIDLEKYLESGTEASAKRIRATSKILETLGKSFRVQSVKSKPARNMPSNHSGHPIYDL
jgi:hypothetical protein